MQTLMDKIAMMVEVKIQELFSELSRDEMIPDTPTYIMTAMLEIIAAMCKSSSVDKSTIIETFKDIYDRTEDYTEEELRGMVG